MSQALAISAGPAAAAKAAPAPAPLQRGCACGGPARFDGQCERCEHEARFGPPPVLQAKLTIGAPDDPLEKEAEAVADRVMRMPASAGASILHDERPHLQRQPASSGAVSPVPGFAAGLAGQSAGAPLPASARGFFEPRFARDLGHVRIHDDAATGALARDINARAFTLGSDIYFGAGEYDPVSSGGRRLLAHELTHVFQQSGTGQDVIRRVPPQARVAPPSPDASPGHVPEATTSSANTLEEIRPSRVTRITVSCTDRRMRIETAAGAYYYRMDACNLALGDYTATVRFNPSDQLEYDLLLDFGASVSSTNSGEFRYRIAPGQENPASLLAGQSRVSVHVVRHLPAVGRVRGSTPPAEPQCVVSLPPRQLVPPASFDRPLFSPLTLAPTSIWSHRIPLGWYGWVDVDATVSGGLSGDFHASSEPGMLTDICLTRLVDQRSASAPIDHPLLGRGSEATSALYTLGGRARFSLPARAQVTLRAQGRLRIDGEYLSTIELAAAEGSLTATGTASLSGRIDASVDVLARMARDSATLRAPLLPLSTTITHSSLQGIDLAARIGLRGRAALGFSLDGGASFSLLGQELWAQQWRLADFNTGVGWEGGLAYSPNPGLHWDLGGFGALAEGAANELRHERTLDEVEAREDSALIDGPAIVRELFDEREAPPRTPQGLSSRDPLPFEWRKPIGIYATVLNIPRADDPHQVSREAGPTPVRYTDRGRTVHERLGVRDWPAVGRTFQYIPYDERRTPEQRRFNGVLDRLGFDRSGFDAEHVWDVKLRGLNFDRFWNLWPASNQEQQLAGTQHDRQIRNYEATLGNVNGRHFGIVRVRHPAS